MEAAESQARSMESDSRSGNVNSSERGHFDSPKRGGGLILRLCIDMRKKNEAIVRDDIIIYVRSVEEPDNRLQRPLSVFVTKDRPSIRKSAYLGCHNSLSWDICYQL